MCLVVKKSHVVHPIPEMECVKILCYDQGEWSTPYRGNVLRRGTGWFSPKRAARERRMEFSILSQVNGGYLHAYKDLASSYEFIRVVRNIIPKKRRYGRYGFTYAFRAFARDVVAVGNSDLVCKALYIPAFDITGEHRHAQIEYT